MIDVLVVHTAFSKVREGTPRELIDRLRAMAGTLVMPSMADDDDHPFDPASSPCTGMGVVADTFWRMPGVLRSDSPHAFAAAGPHAAAITAPHPADVPHGLDSPAGRAWKLDAHVLLIGAGHDANTTIHLAENLAGVRYGIRHRANTRQGLVEYKEPDHCCEKFALLDDWLGDRQQHGRIGRAETRLARARDIVEAALQHLRENETVFLHEPGVCGECDLARSQLHASAAAIIPL